MSTARGAPARPVAGSAAASFLHPRECGREFLLPAGERGRHEVPEFIVLREEIGGQSPERASAEAKLLLSHDQRLKPGAQTAPCIYLEARLVADDGFELVFDNRGE